MKAERLTIDWQQAYASLERMRQSLDRAGEPSPAEAVRILAARARMFAQAPPAPSEAAMLDLLAFSLGAARHAIEASFATDVLRATELTRVPCTPPFVLGVLNHRGRIVPVLDLQLLIGRGSGVASDDSRVVILAANGMSFGIVAAAIEAGVRVAADTLLETQPAAAGSAPALVRGVTPDMIAVVDVDALARDRRIVVDEEVA